MWTRMCPYVARFGHGLGTPTRRMTHRERRAGWGVAAGSAAHAKLPSGRWQARYLGPDMVRHVGPTAFGTKGDAQAWLAEERRLMTQGQWLSPHERAIREAAAESARRGRTFSVHAEQWLATRVTSKGEALRPTTKAGYRNSLDVHILLRFGSLTFSRTCRGASTIWLHRPMSGWRSWTSGV